MMEHQQTPVNNRSFLLIWAVLVALVLINVTISQMIAGSLKIWMILASATVQASLVLTVLMHLKDETKMFRLGILTLLVIVAVFIGLTFTDVLYR